MDHKTVNHGIGKFAKREIHMNNNENRHYLLRKFLKIFLGVSKYNLQGHALLEQFRINYKVDSHDMIFKSKVE